MRKSETTYLNTLLRDTGLENVRGLEVLLEIEPNCVLVWSGFFPWSSSGRRPEVSK